MDINIIPLDKQDYLGHKTSVSYTTSQYFSLVNSDDSEDFSFILRLNDLPDAVTKTFEISLYPDYFPDAKAYGVFQDRLIGIIELNHESWNNRLRITELWVERSKRRMGIGSKLVAFAIAEAKRLGARMVVLETQTTNVEAIGFYREMGFAVAGIDLNCYSNEDVKTREVRLEMGMKVE